MTYAFTFDASACTGCKACQVACQDKNQLPDGVLWRRVYEVSGGGWQQQGSAWMTDVFAYNLSIACNHCVHPKCAGVCPVDAYVQRPDGIVYIDERKCTGCGYCAWACPYSAPRYNPDLRHMTKCNFCMDNLDLGLPPACVAACPLRVLDFTVIRDQPSESGAGFQQLWETPGVEHPFPLPEYSRTQPHLAIRPHVGMRNGQAKAISNQEEINPRHAPRGEWHILLARIFEEGPLVLFTLFAQAAAGLAGVLAFTGLPVVRLGLFFQVIAYLVGAGIFAFWHLKTPRNAWRALSHLQKSWLSREILMAAVFGLAWFVVLAQIVEQGSQPVKLLRETNFHVWLWLPALAGLGFVHSMAQVYRIKAVPGWNTWRTNAAFVLTMGVLGLVIFSREAGLASVWIPLLVLLAAEAGLALSAGRGVGITVNRLRVILIGAAMAGLAAAAWGAEGGSGWLSASIALILIAQEILGRALFYTALDERVM